MRILETDKFKREVERLRNAVLQVLKSSSKDSHALLSPLKEMDDFLSSTFSRVRTRAEALQSTAHYDDGVYEILLRIRAEEDELWRSVMPKLLHPCINLCEVALKYLPQNYVICASCESKMPRDAKFCGECGARLR